MRLRDGFSRAGVVRSTGVLLAAGVIGIAALRAECATIANASQGRPIYVAEAAAPSQPLYKPRKWVLAGDGSYYLSAIHWLSYNGPVARATAIAHVENYMTHKFYSAYSVRVQLSHPQLKCGRYFYTTISQHYPAHLPPDRRPHFAQGSLGFFPCGAAQDSYTARPRDLAEPLATVVATSASRSPSLKNCNPRTGRLIPVSALQGSGPFAPGHSELMATRNVSCETAARLNRAVEARCQGGSCNVTFHMSGFTCRAEFDGGGDGLCRASQRRRVIITVP